MARSRNSMFLATLVAVGIGGATERALAKSGVDAIQLENIPLDASVDCSRTFFKSTRHFNGTIYVMPRVVPAQTDDEHPFFDIESDGSGRYTLAIGLRFPRNDEQIENQWSASSDSDSRCNFDVVKEALNKDISDPSQKIKRIAPMPLTSIEVSVPGAATIGRIGRRLETDSEVDILDYDGKSLSTEIPLSESEKDGVVRRLNRIDGIPVQVRFRFQARSRDGGVNATIDWQKLAASVEASLSGKRVVAQAELEVALQTSLKKMSASIQVDSGQSPAFDKIAAQIAETVLKQISAKSADDAPLKADLPKGGDSPLTLIDVKAAVALLAAQESTSIEYEQNSGPETATAETLIYFRSHLQDPNLREVRVRAGFANPTLDEPILAGQTIKITAAYHFLARFRFTEARRTYLTQSQIQELRLDERFPDLASPQMVVENQTVGGRLMAVGRWIPLAGYSPVYSPAQYFWRRTERTREMVPDFGKPIPPTLEALQGLPITVAFSNLGGRFSSKLVDLIGDHPAWSARFDENGTIILTAKQDLGLMTFLEHFEKDHSSIVPGETDLTVGGFVMDAVTEERLSPASFSSVGRSVVLKSDPITIVKSRYVIFNVSRPSSAPAVPSTPLR